MIKPYYTSNSHRLTVDLPVPPSTLRQAQGLPWTQCRDRLEPVYICWRARMGTKGWPPATSTRGFSVPCSPHRATWPDDEGKARTVPCLDRFKSSKLPELRYGDFRRCLRARAGQGVIVGGVVGEDYRKLGLSGLITAGRMHGAAVEEQHIPRGK